MSISLFGTSRKGRKHGASTSQNADNSSEYGADVEPTRLRIAQNLRSVIDPEVGLNIVDLGLIYEIQVDDGIATVRVTMTTPACPMSSYIKQQVGHALQHVPGLRRGVVEQIWEPAWSPMMIAPEARLRR